MCDVALYVISSSVIVLLCELFDLFHLCSCCRLAASLMRDLALNVISSSVIVLLSGLFALFQQCFCCCLAVSVCVIWLLMSFLVV